MLYQTQLRIRPILYTVWYIGMAMLISGLLLAQGPPEPAKPQVPPEAPKPQPSPETPQPQGMPQQPPPEEAPKPPIPNGTAKQPPRREVINPLLEAQRQPLEQLQDYRANYALRQREPQEIERDLPLFGYGYFEPARQVIDARRARMAILVKHGGPLSKDAFRSPPPPETVYSEQEEIAAVAALSDAQKLDLFMRLRDGTLTEEEKRRYRRLLFRADTLPSLDRATPGEVLPGVERQLNLPAIDAFFETADPLATILQRTITTVPATYQLSGGDILTLRYWSPTMEMQERTLVVDETGGITLAEMGRVIVRGQTLAQAEATLRQRLSQFIKGVQVSITLKELRTMPVTVIGQAYYPGTYNVPAIATAYNLLFACGGPNSSGTMRRIEVRRRGKTVGIIDFYKFLLSGDQAEDIPLEPGDVLLIPPRLKRVTVNGEVRRKAIYELFEHEMLKDALYYAGGVKPSGVSQRIQVSTLKPGSSRLLKDIDLTALEGKDSIPLYDGDIIDVFSVRTTLVNKVSIEGAVDQPGQYELVPNMTVTDLISRARGLLSDAYPKRADLFRVNPDNTLTLLPVDLEKALAGDPEANIRLSRWDRLVVYTRDFITWTRSRYVTVRGAVRSPGIFPRSDNMRVSDLLLQAGGTRPEAYLEQAVLLHQRADGSYVYDYINLNEAIKENPKHNLLLRDGDLLAVYRMDEVQFTPSHTVRIQGEVVSPGVYPRGEGMRLSDVLRLAGGLTPRAGDRIQVAHARIDEGEQSVTTCTYSTATSMPTPDPVLKDGDVITIQGRGTYQERPYIVTVEGAVNRPGPVVLRGPQVRLSEVIREAGGLKSEAYPEGAELKRDPASLTTGTQKQITEIISKLNDALNLAEYRRELAKSDIERSKVLGSSSKPYLPISIPGIGSFSPTSPAEVAAPTGEARELVSRPRILSPEELSPSGNIVIDLVAALKQPAGEADILMVDGDTVTIPVKPTTIQVVGAVVYPSGVPFRKGAGLDYYLTEAGGYTLDAARDRVMVVRLGGGLTPIKKLKAFKPGDIILVPTRVMAQRITNRVAEIDAIFRGLTTSTLLILGVKKLLGL